jgi:hypothetical protein
MSENVGREWAEEVSKRINRYFDGIIQKTIQNDEFVKWVIQQRDLCYRNAESVRTHKDPCGEREWRCAAVSYQIVLNKLEVLNFRSDQSIPRYWGAEF